MNAFTLVTKACMCTNAGVGLQELLLNFVLEVTGFFHTYHF